MSRISKIGDRIVINFDNQTINCNGEVLYSFKRSKLKFSLLKYLCENANIALSNEQIYAALYDPAKDYYEDRCITNLVYELRKVIPKDKYPEFAESIQNKTDGYMYTGSPIIDTDKIKSGDEAISNEAQMNISEEAVNGSLTETQEAPIDTRSDQDVIIDNLGKALLVAAEASKMQQHKIAEAIRSNNLFYAFRDDYDQILKDCINIDPSAEPISIQLLDKINELHDKWMLDIRKVSDVEKRTLMQDIHSTLSDYKYYLSDKFLRVMNGSDLLIYKNGSAEEGELLRKVLRPKTVELRSKMKELYERLWPVSDVDQSDINGENSTETSDNSKAPESEVSNGKVVHQTVVNQYGDRPVHIDHVENLNL